MSRYSVTAQLTLREGVGLKPQFARVSCVPPIMDSLMLQNLEDCLGRLYASSSILHSTVLYIIRSVAIGLV